MMVTKTLLAGRIGLVAAALLAGCTDDVGIPDDTETPCGDIDGDGVCDEDDRCEGDDASGDVDDDNICDDLDPCVGDNTSGDSDEDGICDDSDVCIGGDASGDRDGDGVCDDTDTCVQLYDPDQDHACQVVFANPLATGAGDGSTWLDGFTTVQAALDAAESRGAQYEVWLMSGTYRPAEANQPVAVLPAGLVLRGGYASDSTSIRDSTGTTVLSGDFSANDVPLDLDTVEAEREAPNQPSRSDNASMVVVMASNTTLSHIEVADGYTTAVQNGVGIVVPPRSDRVQLLDVFAHHNIGAVRNANGGGLGIDQSSEVEIRGSRFESNIAWNGAAMSLNRVPFAVIDSTQFQENEAMSQGAGVHLFDVKSQFDNCAFIANRIVGNSGSTFVARNSTGSITNALFEANEGPATVQIDADATYRLYNMTMVGQTALDGDPLLLAGPDTELYNSIFYGNQRELSGDPGRQPGLIRHNCAESDWSRLGDANIRLDGRTSATGSPFSTQDPDKRLLAHQAAGDPFTSACVDSGDTVVANQAFPLWRDYTTRADGVRDGASDDAIDMGFHYLEE